MAETQQQIAATQKDAVQQRLLLLRQSRETRTYQMIGKVCTQGLHQ